MKKVWKRIHTWLDANAPQGYGHLRPGATVAAIQAAEKAMGLKLSSDIKASYCIHDGQGKEPGLIGGEGRRLLSLEEIVETWRKWSQFDPKYTRCAPIAWGGAGDYIFLELGPDAESRGGLIVKRCDSDEPDPVAPSFRSWLEDFADKLDDDEFAFSEEDGCIMYADEIDLD